MPARTVACAICRKKRIKCDATLPQCLMCIRTGRKCPGLPVGPLIVDMTNIAKHGMKKRHNKSSNKPIDAPVHFWVHAGARLPQSISHRSVVTEAFYGRFLAYFTSEGEGNDIRNRRTWLDSLPLLSVDGTNEALVLAVQATASAYCAAESGDLALRQHSWKLYGEALRKHTGLISRPPSKHEITVHMVSTSVLFSFFEAMQATTADAYCSHIYGAARMLQVTKPKHCSEGVLCQIFYHLRTQLAFIHLTGTGRGASVQVRRILSRVLEYVRLPIFQRLMDHISALAEMHVKQKDDNILQPSDLAVYVRIKAEIESLWHEYKDEAAGMGTEIFWEDISHGITHFRDAFAALTVAYFSASCILLNLAAPRLKMSSLDFDDCYQTILQASQHLQTDQIGCAYMRIAMPLLLVALYSPQSSQRQQATGHFKRWTNKSLTGVSALALEAICHHHALEKQALCLGIPGQGGKPSR